MTITQFIYPRHSSISNPQLLYTLYSDNMRPSPIPAYSIPEEEVTILKLSAHCWLPVE